MLVHEGIKYQCDHCDYKAAGKGHLKATEMTVHEGIMNLCDLCEYKAELKI